MKLDLSCPIETRGYSLSYANGVAEASVRLYNLTTRRISSFEAIAKWRSQTSQMSIATPFCAERLRAGGENGFRINLVSDRLPDANLLELVFTCVRFDDGDDWRAGKGTIVDIAPLEAISSANLTALRSIAGNDAVCFPKQNDHIWRCVCGRTNPNSADACVRCHREQQIAVRYTPENIRLLADAISSEDSDLTESGSTELHETYLRQRTRLFRRTLATAIAALALTVLLVMSHQPVDAGNASAEAAHNAISMPVEE